MKFNKISKIKKDLGFATSASLLSFLISLVLAPIMTRHFGPADYGFFALINNIATFIATVILFSLPNALPMEPQISRRDQLIRGMIYLTRITVTTFFAGVFLYFFIQSIFFGMDSVEWKFISLPFLILAISVHRISQGWANAEGRFSSMAIARLIHPLIAKPLAILASILTVPSALFIIFFEVLGYISQSWVMLKNRTHHLKKNIKKKKHGIKTAIGIVNRYKDYSLYLNFVNIINIGFLALQVVIITVNYTESETGIYSLALSISSLPIQLVSMATASIIYHKLIEISKHSPGLLYHRLIVIISGYVLLGLVPYMILYFFGQEAFGYVFGDKWYESGVVASKLAFPLFMQFILVPVSSVFRVTRTIKIQFFIDLFFIIPIIIIFYVVCSQLKFYQAIDWLAVLMSIHAIISITLLVIVSKKKSRDFSKDDRFEEQPQRR